MRERIKESKGFGYTYKLKLDKIDSGYVVWEEEGLYNTKHETLESAEKEFYKRLNERNKDYEEE